MRTSLWVLTSFCIELACIELAAGAASVAELELELARTGDVYLKIDSQRLAVLVSGVELTSVPLAAVELYGYRPWRATDPIVAVEMPAVLSVVDDVSAPHRRVVAPEDLRPYSERGTTAAVSTSGAVAPPPSAYSVRLEGSRILELRNQPVSLGLPARMARALRDGWAIRTGKVPERPDRIVLVVGPEDARRLHHLFRAGTRILVLVPSR